MNIVGKHFEFESAHKLPDKECYGACRNMHGHTYKMTVEIEGYIQPEGWITNFKDLKDIVNTHVISRYDHRNLNDFFDIPTVEIMVVEIANILTSTFEKLGTKYKLHSVTLYETSTSYAKVICQ